MPNITIYTTPTYIYCKMMKAFLKEHNIPYNEKNVAADGEARDEMIRKSGQMGVPVIEVGGKIIVGFYKDRISELVGIKE